MRDPNLMQRHNSVFFLDMDKFELGYKLYDPVAKKVVGRHDVVFMVDQMIQDFEQDTCKNSSTICWSDKFKSNYYSSDNRIG